MAGCFSQSYFLDRQSIRKFRLTIQTTFHNGLTIQLIAEKSDVPFNKFMLWPLKSQGASFYPYFCIKHLNSSLTFAEVE
jgi:hypothetical protein